MTLRLSPIGDKECKGVSLTFNARDLPLRQGGGSKATGALATARNRRKGFASGRWETGPRGSIPDALSCAPLTDCFIWCGLKVLMGWKASPYIAYIED